jgi:hypothetical protein
MVQRFVPTAPTIGSLTTGEGTCDSIRFRVRRLCRKPKPAAIVVDAAGLLMRALIRFVCLLPRRIR